MGSIMGSQNIMGLDYGSNISVLQSEKNQYSFGVLGFLVKLYFAFLLLRFV